ncbi:MAG TPA: mersacidin/lichenicidin family type 2 lantibiotic [Thermoanaerobaculia bacterium]|jgi:mersacidin/lichenicidin family type 2 lantibiotic|nr:mersacidin/lichenicidin family type 2 lantibiotic [Thermoanaerobaculia bacterium]
MHKNIDVVRAWRDEEYRNSLSEQERAGLPENPAGFATVDDSALRSAQGASSFGCPTTFVASCVKPGQSCP